MEVVRAHLERIAAVGDRVHAIVTLFGRPSARRSSGGESPATASGISPIGLGSDTIFVRGRPHDTVIVALKATRGPSTIGRSKRWPDVHNLLLLLIDRTGGTSDLASTTMPLLEDSPPSQ
ncbi:hypothetical protein ACTXG6_33710 [Pseudonocardia sp. Cha107L01]|jgi:hypothetical protein|uniref:hypothetical protein n=1 Tax=Pseudonocardia sp. Cha107L01 TaxID=3457576 RepID=UPI00403EF4EC